MRSVAVAISLFAFLLPLTAAAQSADVWLTVENYNTGPKVQAGSPVNYRITIRNDGPDTARDVTLTITSSPVARSARLLSFPCTGVTCAVGVLPARQTVVYIYEERFDAEPMTVSSTMRVSASTPDPKPDNNSVAGITQIVSQPDLFPSVSFLPTTEAEAAITIDAGVVNQGVAPAHDVVFVIDFPPGTNVLAARPPAEWECSVDSPKVTCRTPLLAAKSPFMRIFFDVIAPPRYDGGFETIRAQVTTSDENFRPGPLTYNLQWFFFRFFPVTSSADEGGGTLRDAILQANVGCNFNCRIGFRLPEAEREEGGWFTIRPLKPLPAITSSVTVAGPAGTEKSGQRIKPLVMLDGSRLTAGNGLEITGGSSAEVFGLAIGNFPGAGILVSGANRNLHDNFIGTLPNGIEAAPNERGIVTGPLQVNSLQIRHNVVSGNRRSGIALTNVTRPYIAENAIGLGADGTTPVPNGASGVYLGVGCDWATLWLDDIAYNGEFGVAIHPSVRRVLASINAIYGNRLLGIDYGIDLATPNVDDDDSGKRLPNHPVIASARWDAASGRTTIEGEMLSRLSPNPNGEQLRVELYADEGDHPEARFYLGTAPVSAGRFRLTVPRDLRGQSVTGIGIRFSYGPWFPLNEQISEISDPVKVE